MADFESKINLNIDSAQAIAAINTLQQRISAFHSSMAKSGAVANSELAKMRTNLINSINATGAFRAGMTTVASATDSFTTALEKNKLTMGETFRYTMGATKTFGRFFRNEMDLVSKVSRERTKTIQTQYMKMGRDANGAMQAIKVRPLILDMKNLETQTMMNAQRIQVLNKLIDHGSTQLLNFGKNTQWAGRQLMVGFTVPLTILGGTAARVFMEMEKEVIKLKRVYGDFSTSVQNTDKMVSSIKTLATEFTKFGIAAKDTMSLAAEAAAAGAQGAALINQVTEATRLAVLGNVDQQQAYETTISLTNSFGIATEQLAGKIDFLNAVENQTVTSIEDLTEAIPKAAPVVKQLGGDVEDLTFFMTAMKEGGINASEGANALKSGLAAIINPTQKASDMLKGMGVNLKGIVEGNAGDVKQMVIDLGNALNDLNPLDRAKAIEQLFGKFQFSRISTLLQNVTKEGTQAQKVLGLANASSAELAVMSKRELDKVQSSTTFKFQAAWEKFQQALAPVGEQFLKAVTPLLDFGTKILEQFNSWGDGAKNFSLGLIAALGVVGPTILMAVGLVSNGIANLMKFFAFLSRAFTGATKDSTTLGMETRYMTQAQLEAAAVATSLGQTHGKLKQIYTSETEALVSLTSALNRAVAAQERFGAAGGGALTTRGKKAPKKYAQGVVMVPGPKGAGDIIPAMLAPGEAVIPAKKAQKYAGLIDGIIAGNIPGFEEGKSTRLNAPEGMGQSQSAHYGDPTKYKQRFKDAKAAMDAFDKDWKPLVDKGLMSEAEFKAMRSKAARVAKQREGKDLGRLDSNTISLDSKINQDYNHNRAVTRGQISGSLAAEGSNAFSEQHRQLREAGVSEKDAKAIISDMHKEVTKQFAGGKGAKATDVIKEADFSKAVEKGVTTALKKAEAKARNSSEGQKIARVQAQQGLITGFSYQGEKKQGRTSDPGRTRGYFAGNPQRLSPLTAKELGASRLKNSIMVDDKLVKEMQKQGLLGKGKQTTEAAAKKLKDIFAKQSIEERKAMWKRFSEAKTASERIAQIKSAPQPTTAKPKSLPKPKLAGFEAVDPASGMYQDEHGNTYKNGKYFDKDGKQTSAKALAEKKAALASRPTRRGKGMGAAAVGGAVLASSIAGGTPLDDTINNVMTGSMMSMMLPQKFQAAGGIIIAAALSIKSAIDAFNERISKATQAGVDLANAMSTTNQKLSDMGEQLGTVGISEMLKMKNDMRVSGLSDPAQLSEGRRIADSEIGQQTIADYKNVSASMGKEAANKSLSSQLGMYIAQGIMTKEQAFSFAYAIGRQMNDMTITTNVDMDIRKMIGPNGEDLENEPISVAMKLEEASMDAFRRTISSTLTEAVDPTNGGLNPGFAALGAGQVTSGAYLAGKGIQPVAQRIAGSKFGQVAGKVLNFGSMGTTGAAGKAGSAFLKAGDAVTGKVGAGLVKAGDKVLAKVGQKATEKIGEKVGGILLRKLGGGLLKLAAGTATAGTGVGVAVAVAGIADLAMGVWEIGAAVADYNRSMEHNAKAGAVALVQSMNTLQQLQQSKDIIEETYTSRKDELEKQLEQATTAEERRRIEKEINDLLLERNAALEQNKTDTEEVTQASRDIIQRDTGKAFDGEDAILKKQAGVTFKDDPIMLDYVNSTIDEISAAGLKDKEVGIDLGINLAYGNIDPDTANAIIERAKDDQPFSTAMEVLISERGLVEGSAIQKLLNNTLDKDGNVAGVATIPVEVITAVTGDETSLDTVEMLTGLNRASGGKIALTVDLVTDANALQTELEDTSTTYDLNYVTRMNDQTGGQFQDILNNWGDISGPDGIITRDAFIQMQLAIQNPDAIRDWAKENSELSPTELGAMSNTDIVNQFGGRYIQSLNVDTSDVKDTVKGTRTVTKQSSGAGDDPELQRLQGQQEKKQKALDVIAIREERINKKYDERKKALQEIADAQAQISDQQKNQLDLADALASGDVAAAVRAAQAIQAKNAEVAAQKQQDALEEARKRELDTVSFRGMTRGGLEPQLDKLKEQIAIREYELAPKKKGGGGSYQVEEKTEKPAYDADHVKGEGDWVYGKDKDWHWKRKDPKLTPASVPTSGYVPYSAGHGNVLGPGVPGVDANGNPIPGYVAPTPKVPTYGPTYAPPSSPSFSFGNLGPSGLPPTSPGWRPPMAAPVAPRVPVAPVVPRAATVVPGIATLPNSTWRPPMAAPTAAPAPLGPVKLPALDIKQPTDSLLLLKTKTTDLKTPVDNATTSVGNFMTKIKGISTTLPTSLQPFANAASDINSVISGKMTAAQYKALHKATGGYISGAGTATSDSIPAMLSNGEFVVKASSVKKLGVPFLQALNDAPKFASGGYAMSGTKVNSYSTGGAAKKSSADFGNSVYNYNVIVNAKTNANADDIANAVMVKIKRSETQRIGGR